MFQNKKKSKVFVGLSGGVDSSVSAALLKRQGYDVAGVFIKVWQPEFVKCDWREDRLDAMRVCAKLDIPFVDLDLEDEYKKEVFDYMISEYKKGRTPNPDAMCNKSIKFGGFLKWALANGSDYVATGHYARSVAVEYKLDKNKPIFNFFKFFQKLQKSQEVPVTERKYQLLAGVDKNKDQSYFLWTLKQEQLKHILFPIGHLEKSEVRKLAKKFGLLTAEKKDSQGLCFVGMVEMKDFLKKFIPEKKGNILNLKGEIIGEHDGACYYTVGQRHGFLITKKTSTEEPYFVVGKNIEKNELVVSHHLEDDEKKEIILGETNWVFGSAPIIDKQYFARIRYRQILQSCRFSSENKIIFEQKQKAVSAGQSLVLYDGDVCLGGGVIL